MNILNVLLIGIGLAMDAAAVSLCKGLAVGKAKMRHCLLAGAYFGMFQGAMPAIGYALGRTFADFINAFDHWVAFILLVLIGANMLKESFEKEETCCECQSTSFAPAVMLPMAVATSIDALAVGVTFSFDMNWIGLLMAVLLIAAVTFVISAVAVRLGSLLGTRFGSWAERAGGLVLILMGVKILLEGLGVLA